MPSFDMRYDEEEDFLEVTFEVFDERFARSFPLNDHIFVHTDLGFSAVWGLTFYSYGRLLGVSETELTGLQELADEQIDRVLALLGKPPARHFFDVTDPQSLVARVRAPNLYDLVSPPV